MNESLADDLRAAIMPKVMQGMENFARNLVIDIQDRISVDVEFEVGPRGGVRVIRSDPGEPPRRESYDLWSSIEIIEPQIVSATEIEVFVVTYNPKARWLNEGTINIDARPFWPTQEELESMLPALFTAVASEF